MNKAAYNPFHDKTLHLTVKPTEPHRLDERAPFNDVIAHGDIVQGFQAPKQADQIMGWVQTPYRICAYVSVLMFAAFMIYDVVSMVLELAGRL